MRYNVVATSNYGHGKQVLERYKTLKKYDPHVCSKNESVFSTLTIEIVELKDLMQLINDLSAELGYNAEIIMGREDGGSDNYCIEIYDGYRE